MQTSTKRNWIKRPEYWDSDTTNGLKDIRKAATRNFRRQNKAGADPEIIAKNAGWYW